MLSRLYVFALLVDVDLADQVWELWHAAVITHGEAAIAWLIVATSGREVPFSRLQIQLL